MCIPLAVATLAVTAVSTAASMAASSSQQATAKRNAQDAAHASNVAASKQAEAEYKAQEDQMRYADKTWQQDIDFATATLDYQGKEFTKQADYVSSAGQAVLKNEDSNLGQVALQAAQKHIALTLQETNIASQGATARATAQVEADARGVEGHSVNAIIGDVSRQQGQAASVMEMNRSAMQQQARIDMEATKATGDSQLGQLQAGVKIYSPSTPIRTPGASMTVQDPTFTIPAARSALGDSLAIAGAGIQGGIAGFNGINTLTGTSTEDSILGIKNLF